MISAEFRTKNGQIAGFRVSGHSGYAEQGQDIVCAAVSSAVQLAANIITDGFRARADVRVGNGRDNAISLDVRSPDDRTEAVLRMLIFQLETILEEFPGTIKISYPEV